MSGHQGNPSGQEASGSSSSTPVSNQEAASNTYVRFSISDLISGAQNPAQEGVDPAPNRSAIVTVDSLRTHFHFSLADSGAENPVPDGRNQAPNICSVPLNPSKDSRGTFVHFSISDSASVASENLEGINRDSSTSTTGSDAYRVTHVHFSISDSVSGAENPWQERLNRPLHAPWINTFVHFSLGDSVSSSASVFISQNTYMHFSISDPVSGVPNLLPEGLNRDLNPIVSEPPPNSDAISVDDSVFAAENSEQGGMNQESNAQSVSDNPVTVSSESFKDKMTLDDSASEYGLPSTAPSYYPKTSESEGTNRESSTQTVSDNPVSSENFKDKLKCTCVSSLPYDSGSEYGLEQSRPSTSGLDQSRPSTSPSDYPKNSEQEGMNQESKAQSVSDNPVTVSSDSFKDKSKVVSSPSAESGQEVRPQRIYYRREIDGGAFTPESSASVASQMDVDTPQLGSSVSVVTPSGTESPSDGDTPQPGPSASGVIPSGAAAPTDGDTSSSDSSSGTPTDCFPLKRIICGSGGSGKSSTDAVAAKSVVQAATATFKIDPSKLSQQDEKDKKGEDKKKSPKDQKGKGKKKE